MSKFCEHNPIFDQSTGTEVCYNCALVLTDNLSYDEIHFHGNNESKNDNITDMKKMLVNGVDTVPSFIRTVGDQMHLCNNTIETAILNFGKFVNKCDEIKALGIKQHRKINTNLNMATYAIYTTLKEEGNPRPLSHVCMAAGVYSTGDIWKLEKYFTRFSQGHFTRSNKTRNLTAKDLLYSYYSLLELDFNDANEMARMIEFIPSNNGFTPTTTAAALMYLYTNKIKKIKCPISKIAQLCQTSSMSIHRFMKRNKSLIDNMK